MTLRLAYNRFTQKPKDVLADFCQWTQLTKPGTGDDFYRVNGAGEMLVYSAMALLTWVGVWPTSALIAIVLVPNLPSLPYPVSSAVVAAAIVLCLAWIVMPALVQLCHSWLH